MINPWLNQKVFIALPIIESNWQNSEELKLAFAIELTKNHANAFIAACEVFKKETNKALYASVNWVNDPFVIEAKQKYLEIASSPAKLLDKEALSAKLLTFSDEKIVFNGNEVYAAEAKDRLKALELYAKIQGFINDKTEINNNNNISNKFMEIRFVEPERKENVKIIERTPVEQEEENILDASPIKLKLVG